MLIALAHCTYVTENLDSTVYAAILFTAIKGIVVNADVTSLQDHIKAERRPLTRPVNRTLSQQNTEDGPFCREFNFAQIVGMDKTTVTTPSLI